MLTHLPPLPLTVDYYASHTNGTNAKDEMGILLALEQCHHICHLHLFFHVENLQKLIMAIDGEFLILEYLIVYPMVMNSMALVLPETF